MKYFFYFILLISTLVYSDTQISIFELSFNQNSKDHFYTLVSDGKINPHYKLIFKDKNKPSIEKNITNSFAKTIKNESNRILWISKYKNQKTKLKCTPYLTLKISKEKTTVCHENKIAISKSYGLLNSVSRVFQ